MGLFNLFQTTNSNNSIKVGDRVYIKWTGQTGYVIDITGNMVQVSITREDESDIVKTYRIDEVKPAKGII